MDACFPTSLFLIEEQSWLKLFISWLIYAFSIVYQLYKSSRIIHSFIIISIQHKASSRQHVLREIHSWMKASVTCPPPPPFFLYFSFVLSKMSCMFLKELLYVVSFTNGDNSIVCYTLNNAVACMLWLHRLAPGTVFVIESERIILLWVGAKNIHQNQLIQNKNQAYSAGSSAISFTRTPLPYLTHCF